MREKFAHYPGALLAFGLAAGIVIERYLAIPILPLLAIFIIATILALLLRKHAWPALLFSIMFILAGSVSYRLWADSHIQHPLLQFFPLENASINGTILKPPSAGKPEMIIRSEEIIAEESALRIQQNFIVKLRKARSAVLPGDRVELKNVRIEHLPPLRNPGQFNYGSYLRERGILGMVRMTTASSIHYSATEEKFLPSRFLYSLRENLSSQIRKMLPPEAASFLTGILLGEKEGISREVKSDFQNSGVAHVLAISGLHVGFVVIIIHILLSFLPIGFRWHNILTIAFLSFYMLLTGANPPVVRATLMVAIYLIGKNLERVPNVYNTIFTAACIILLLQPQQLFLAGFQFSFVAVLSIIYFYRALKPLESKAMQLFGSGKSGKWVKNLIITPFLVSLSAQLGTIPLMAVYFHKIPLISFVLNLIAIPLVGLIVPLGFLAVSISYLSFSLAVPVSSLLASIIQALINIVHLAANLPWSYFNLPDFTIFAVILYLLILWLVFTWTSEPNLQVRKPALIAIVAGFLWLIAPRAYHPEILTLDVGQAEASLVRTSENKLLLFDAGSASPEWDNGRSVIFPAIQRMGKLHLDKVIISHPHADHIGGMFSLIELVDIDSVYLPDLRTYYFLQDSLLRELGNHHIPVRLLKMGDIVRVDAKTRIFILAPFTKFREPSGTSGSQINNTSLVALLKTGNASILFTGDAELPVETRLAEWGSLAHSEILKAGHHGSGTSSGQQFLEQVSPQFCIIPVGRNNRYGHPGKDVLNRLRNLGIRYFRTDFDGAVWLRLRNKEWNEVRWR